MLTTSHKITIPKPSRRETYPAACCRLADQGRRNGTQVRPIFGGYAHELTYGVSSQSNAGGYTVTNNIELGSWACACPAHDNNTLCAHIALVRTYETECPVCGAWLLYYADRAPDGHGYQGAVRCTGVCGLIADLTDDEAARVYDARLGLGGVLLGLLLHVARRLSGQEAA